MERFLEKMIPLWLMIHVGFVTYQLLDSYAFNPETAGKSPDYSVSILQAGQPEFTGASETPSTVPQGLNTNLNRRTPLDVKLQEAMDQDLYSGIELGNSDGSDVGNFLISLACRVKELGAAFQLFFSLFVLDYPFVQQFKDQGEGVILWGIQIMQYAGVFTGVMFLIYLGLLFVRSGLIGALLTPKALLGAGGVALFGGLGVNLLATLLKCG